MNRRLLQELARVKFTEAKALLNAGLPDGAYYLAGYAVECALKAVIAKKTRRFEFLNKGLVLASHTHDLEQLVMVSGLDTDHRSKLRQDAVFAAHRGVVKQWSEQSRYERYHPSAVEALVKAVGESRHGVLTWIKQNW